MNVHKPLSSFGLPGEGVRTIRFRSVVAAVRTVTAARRQGLPVIPIGAGTNCVFLEPKLPAVFLQSRDKTLNIERETLNKQTFVTAGAGLLWDDLVRFAVRHNLRGLECLSGIPGTCGAAPVQNIGAYGTELATTLRSVDVLNLKTFRMQKLSRKECRFGYRRSIFNTAERGTFLICSITLALTSGEKADMPEYPDLKRRFSAPPSLRTLRQTVLRIRRQKLPDYKTTPNCGSFFKNPIVSVATAKGILKKYPTLPHWPTSDGTIKLSTAWLIDHAGLRDKHWGKIRISPQHALVLVNEGDHNHKNLKRAIKEIAAAVHRNFGVALAPEPNLLDETFVDAFARKQIVSSNTWACIAAIRRI
jgi:UDP-N-acetylmuramate dehydrogenase